MLSSKLDGLLEGLSLACRSIESLVANLDRLVASEDIPRMMSLIELLDTQSILVNNDYLLVSVEEAESGADSEGPSG